MGLKIPPGFKFDPSDKQLLEDYLKPKIQGKQLPCDLIKEKEIYGPNANPWELFNDPSTQWITSGVQKSVYVFAHLTKIADKESSGFGNEHYVRKAGCGTWHVETGRRPIKEGNNLIGEKRMLVFQINDINGSTDGVDCYWKMHEYFLKGYDDYVVCRITFDTRKKAKVSTKSAVAGTRGGTKSKANKKIATTCTTKDDERKKAVLVENFCDSEKEVASFHDSGIVDSNYIVEGGDYSTYGLSYENQRYHEESSGMMIHQNLLASTNSVCRDGSDQGLVLNKGLPQYDDAGGNVRVEEQEGQGLNVINDDQRLNYEEEAKQLISTSGDSENQGTVLSDFNCGSHDEVYLDLEDLFDGDFWSDVDNVLMEQMEQPLPNDDVSLDFEGLFDIGSWSDKKMEELGKVNNNVQEQHQQQQPMPNVSCMLGKSESFEAQEEGPSKKSRI